MLTMALAAVTMTTSLPKLSPRGIDMVDPRGKKVVLKGCNLGNWLILESWMLCMSGPQGFEDQLDLENTLSKRFGEKEKDRLMDVYRSSWITERDFPIIRSFGFNVVRLPMNYRLMEDDRSPFHLKPDAWKWIDRAVDLAERNGIYTILDMHGAQGGQSVYDHTGHSGQNRLWSVKENSDRLAWLWSQIAKRYRNRTAVVAYDVFNEPYGGSKPDQVRVFRQVLSSIREADPDKLVFAHGNSDTFTHYGNPKANGWHNVGFEMHYYPGMFGNGPMTVLTNAKHLRALESVAAQVRAVDVPFLVGEMNVVGKVGGGAAMMRRYYDTHSSYGWMTTMWSYKAESKEGGIGDGSWGMVTNRQPARTIDLHTAGAADIERWMRGYATEEYEVYDELRTALTARKPVLPPLPEIPKPILSVPYQDALDGWSTADIGGARKGGLKRDGDAFTLYGGGGDIWGRGDQFRYLYRTADRDFDLTVNVKAMHSDETYAKAGLMVRQSLQPDAPAWMVSVFPGGEVQFASRSEAAAEMQGSTGVDSTLPIRLRLSRNGTKLTAFFASGREPWQEIGSATVTGPVTVGPIALSHDDGQLIPIDYDALRFAAR